MMAKNLGVRYWERKMEQLEKNWASGSDSCVEQPDLTWHDLSLLLGRIWRKTTVSWLWPCLSQPLSVFITTSLLLFLMNIECITNKKVNTIFFIQILQKTYCLRLIIIIIITIIIITIIVLLFATTTIIIIIITVLTSHLYWFLIISSSFPRRLQPSCILLNSLCLLITNIT